MIESFRQAMRNLGVETKEDIVADGLLHRFRVEGEKAGSKNGWYILHGDGNPVGQFGAYKLGIDKETWSSKDNRNFTPEEKAIFAAKMQDAQQQRDADHAKIQAECRAWCKATFGPAKDANNKNQYLKAKGVQAYGVKQLADSLVIPVRDSAGIIHGLQFIKPDGSKKFKTGTAKQGNYFSIGRPQGNTLLICEGYATGASLHESTGHAVAVCFDAGNLQPVAESLRKKFPDIRMVICADNDESGVGQEKAAQAADAVGGVVAMPNNTGDDFNDLHQKEGLAAVKAIVEQALVTDKTSRYFSVTDRDCSNQSKSLDCYVVTDRTPPPDDNKKNDDLRETVAKLATLSSIEYDQVRKKEADRLGVRMSALDQAVKAEGKNGGTDNDLPFKDIEPWKEDIDPSQLISDIVKAVQRFIVCGEEVATAVALWAAMTWFLDVVHVAPLAVITAPEKRCGKSQLLTLLGKLVCRPITASSISPAALFRAIDAWEPTLLIDEVDACMKDNEELRGIINSGHTRDSAYVIRTVGDTFTPTKFSTWGAKALSGIGHVADTLMDRAIILELRRKLPHEQVDRLRYAEPGFFDNLAAKLARFAIDYGEQVRGARPYLPPDLNDRAQDNWEPLLAIAMVAGPEWLETTTQTALKISGTESAAQSIGVELLIDIQEIFEEKLIDRISSKDLLKFLVEDDEKPWATYCRGASIKPRQLTNKLKGYDIESKTVRFGSNLTAKGFLREQFEEAFSRYIPPSPALSVTTSQTNNGGDLRVTDSPEGYPLFTHKNARKASETLGCDLVTDRKTIPNVTNTVEVII